MSAFLSDDRYGGAPDSRLVINPYCFEALKPDVSQGQYVDRPSLPLNLGWCTTPSRNGLGYAWENACMLFENDTAASRPALLWSAPLADRDSWRESLGNPTARFHEAGLTLGIDPTSADYPNDHAIQIDVPPCDVSDAVLELNVRRLAPGSKFSVEVSQDNGKTRHCLLYSQDPGHFAFFLGGYAMKKGAYPLQIALHIYEGDGDILTLTDMRILQAAGIRRGAEEYTASWLPYSLVREARYAGGSTASITDCLAESETVVRRHVLNLRQSMTIAGLCPGTARRHGDGLAFDTPAGIVHLSVSPRHVLELYASFVDFLENRVMEHPGPAARIWAVTLPPSDVRTELLLTISSREQTAMSPEAFPLYFNRRKQLWAGWLDKIPLPKSYTLQPLPSDSIEESRVRQAYYTAWAQIIADILPPAPGGAFASSCMTTGKASLWSYGAPECPYAASWETFYGLMLLARLDPAAAWTMYLSYMRLIDEDGVLSGESLPSVKAKTAWLLYTISPCRDHLIAVLPYLERYLHWRLANLRWIYLNRTPYPDEKDIDFVVSALLDIGYQIKICTELKLHEKAAAWKERQRHLYRRFSSWFFAEDSQVYQYYYSSSGARVPGFPLVILKALYLPQLSGAQEHALLSLFDSLYDDSRPFGGFQHVKVENMLYMLYGLSARGRSDTARTLAAITIRDIIASGFFAEEYNHEDGRLLPSGVRPSVFGCALLINALWLLNGQSLTEDAPLDL